MLKRIPHNYNIGDKVSLRGGTENKYERWYECPYTIQKVDDNGTVRLKVKNVEDTYNIQRLTPYLGTGSIDHGGECSMRTSRVKRRKMDESA